MPDPQDTVARAAGFLLWLERYCGTWTAAAPPDVLDAHGDRTAEYEVLRAGDGLLEARDADGERVPLRVPLRGGATLTRTRLDAEAALRVPPLGPGPVILSRPLLDAWMTRADAQRLRGAEHVTRGRELLLALVERRIRERDEERERVAALKRWLSAPALPDRSAEDEHVLASLFAEYEQAVRYAEEAYRVPPGFVFRARRHAEATGGEPLLEYRHAEYQQTVFAVRQHDGGYELTFGEDDIPFGTWREYAAWREVGEEAVLDEHGLDADALDDEIPDPYELLDRLHGSPTARVYSLLESLGIPTEFSCPEMPDEELGRLEFVDGPFPGNDYCGVSATTPMALSCLQYVLDDLQAGVRLVLHSY